MTVLIDEYINKLEYRSYLCHGIIDLFQLLVMVTRVSQRLNHDLLNLREKLLDTTVRSLIVCVISVCICKGTHLYTHRPTFMTVSNIGMRTNLMNPI